MRLPGLIFLVFVTSCLIGARASAVDGSTCAQTLASTNVSRQYTLSQIAKGALSSQQLIIRSQVFDPHRAILWIPRAEYETMWVPLHVFVKTDRRKDFSLISESGTLFPYVDKNGKLILPPAVYQQLREIIEVHRGYGTNIDEHLKKIVADVELNQLMVSRQSVLSVKGQLDGETKGFLRVYDATDYSKVRALHNYHSINGNLIPEDSTTPRFTSPYQAPVELILKALGVRLEALDRLRAQGHPIVEVGAYLLLSSHPVHAEAMFEVLMAKYSLWRWFYNQYGGPFTNWESPYDLTKTIFVCHVATDAHRDTFHREFGFEALPPEETIGLLAHEYVMTATYDQLMPNVRRILNKTLDALRRRYQNWPAESMAEVITQ